MNINSKRLDYAIAVFKGDKPAALRKQTVPKKQKKSKRARSAYSFFVAASRAGWKEKNPDKSFAEFSKSCAAEWKVLKNKSEYEKQAREDRKRRERDEEEEEEADEDEEEEEEEMAEGEDDGHKLEGPDEVVLFDEEPPKSVESGPPFARVVLGKEKMPKLRLLCFMLVL